MGMTREEKASKEFILTLLSKQGYPTYARLLKEFDLNLTENPSIVAYMEPGKGRIVVNRNLNVDQVSTIVRHEILHQYLDHENRLIAELAKDIDLSADEIDDNTLKELKNKLYSNKNFNIAGDYEISNRGYTDADKDIARSIDLNGQILTGLVTEDEHPDWIDLSIEEMYRELEKLQKKDPPPSTPPTKSKPDDDTPWSESESDESKADQPSTNESPADESSTDEPSESGGDGKSSDDPSDTKNDTNSTTSTSGDSEDSEDGEDDTKTNSEKGQKKGSKGYYENPKDGSNSISTGWGDIDLDELEQEDEAREAEIQKEIDSLENELETSEAKLQRIERIKDLLRDADISDTVDKEARAAIQKEKALKADRRRTIASKSPINRFKLSLERFIKDEVSRKRTPTWKRENPSYEGTGIIRRGSMINRNKNIPSINVYFDQSGSWDSNDIKIGMDALAVLDSYVKRKEIKINVFYFANNLFTSPELARAQGGTRAGREVLDHISQTHPDNVIIMTDSDFDSQGGIHNYPTVTVPGAVWFLFRNAESIDLQNALRGNSQTEKYMLQ